MALTDELLKTTNIKGSAMIADAKIFTEAEIIRTSIPALNVACSGSMTGGYGSGITIFAAPSKSFKTLFSLIMLRAFQKKNPDGTIIFYDSEFGSPPEYLKAAGLNLDNIIHIPLKDLEETKFDMVKKLETLKRKDKVLLFIDSIGNLASKKEIDDAIDEKSVADMTRAKQLKSLFRMITPYLSTLDIPLIAVNHTYQEIGMFPKTIMGGGCLVAGTKIQMANGILKNVEDIEVGELVKTLNDDNLVTHIWNPETLDIGEPECCEIEFEDGLIVRCSDTHKFLINGNWVEAKDLMESDDVLAV